MPALRNSSAALPTGGTARTRADAERVEKRFNPRQPRDSHGRWTEVLDGLDVKPGAGGAVASRLDAGATGAEAIEGLGIKPGAAAVIVRRANARRAGLGRSDGKPKPMQATSEPARVQMRRLRDGERIEFASGVVVERDDRYFNVFDPTGAQTATGMGRTQAERRVEDLMMPGGTRAATAGERRPSAPKLMAPADPRLDRHSGAAELGRPRRKLPNSSGSGTPGGTRAATAGERRPSAPKLMAPADPRLDRHSGAAELGRPRRKLPNSSGSGTPGGTRAATAGERRPSAPKLMAPADPRLDRHSGAAELGRPRRKLPNSSGSGTPVKARAAKGRAKRRGAPKLTGKGSW